MLKRRILASSLASVMAISSMAAVVSAAPEDDVVTKASLEEYLKEKEVFMKGELREYGPQIEDHWRDAYDYAKNVVKDANAKPYDYAAAIAMMDAIERKFLEVSIDQLREEFANDESDFQTGNILNPEFGDLIWTKSTFGDFEAAYTEAKNFLKEYDKGRKKTKYQISQMYTKLYDAHNALSKMETVSKSELAAAFKNYDYIIANLKEYESWRRGECSTSAKTGTKVYDAAGKEIKKPDLKGATISFGELISIVYGASDGKKDSVDKFMNTDTYVSELRTGYVKEVKGFSKNDGKTGANTTAKYINYDGADVETFVRTQKDRADAAKITMGETSDPDIVKACKTAKDAYEVFRGWTPDDTDYGTKSTIRQLNNEYHDRIALNFKSDLLGYLMNSAALSPTGKVVNVGDPDYFDAEKVEDIEDCVAQQTSAVALHKTEGTVPTTTDGSSTAIADSAGCDTAFAAVKAGSFADKNYEMGTIRAGANVLKYIPVDNNTCTSGTIGDIKNTDATGWVGLMSTARRIACGRIAATTFANLEELKTPQNADKWLTTKINGKVDFLDVLDELETIDSKVADGTNNDEAWVLVARYLTYAYDDAYDDPEDEEAEKYTLEDVKERVEYAYNLIVDNADKDVLDDVSQLLADACECTNEWVSYADAMVARDKYEDYEIVDAPGASNKGDGYTAKYKLDNDLGKGFIDSAYDFDYINGTDVGTDIKVTSTGAYKFINAFIGYFETKMKAYGDQYDKIEELIGDVRNDINTGLIAGSPVLLSALDECSFYLSVLGTKATQEDGYKVSDEGNEPFDKDRKFMRGRSLKIGTWLTAPTDAEKALKKAYEDLQKLYKAGEEADLLKYDVNGDNKFTTADAAKLAEMRSTGEIDGTEIDLYDFNSDGKVNTADAKYLADLRSQGFDPFK